VTKLQTGIFFWL